MAAYYHSGGSHAYQLSVFKEGNPLNVIIFLNQTLFSLCFTSASWAYCAVQLFGVFWKCIPYRYSGSALSSHGFTVHPKRSLRRSNTTRVRSIRDIFFSIPNSIVALSLRLHISFFRRARGWKRLEGWKKAIIGYDGCSISKVLVGLFSFGQSICVSRRFSNFMNECFLSKCSFRVERSLVTCKVLRLLLTYLNYYSFFPIPSFCSRFFSRFIRKKMWFFFCMLCIFVSFLFVCFLYTKGIRVVIFLILMGLGFWRSVL